MLARFQKIRLPVLASAARSQRVIAPIAAAIGKGIVLDTHHIVAVRQPDGRVALKLHPTLAAKLRV